MRLPPAAFVWAVAAASVGRLAGAQSCCTTDSDCTDMMSTADIEYQSRFDKTLECDQNCPGLINCNMFGLCEQCRGCFLSCEGALRFIEEVSLSTLFITFCSGVGITDISDCEDDDLSSAGGSGSGSGALTGDEGMGSGSGSGVSTASSEASAGYGSGAGAGSGSMSSSGSGSISGSMSSSGSASASGMNTTSDGAAAGYGSGSGSFSSGMSSSGSASASGMNSTSDGAAAGYGSGSGSLTSSTLTAEASGEGSRIADIPGCDCGTAEIEPSFAEYFCTNGKSMYCDLECVDDPDPEDILYPEYGGLWCKPQGWNGCRMCKYDCSDYTGGGCIPCPTGVKDWC